jgi:hypothetical protein
MTKRILRGLVIAWAALVFLSLMSISALADDSQPCSNATLHGSYAFTESGSIVGIGPVAVAGVFKADGKGSLMATDTVSLNGEIISENLNFTYQVNTDCTGGASSVPGQEPAHFNFVIVNFGQRVMGIHTDPGTTLILKARQQFGKTASTESLVH